MKISTLIYCTKEGMRNIIRNIWFSLASVAIISACIFLFCMFFGLIANVQYMVRNAESTVGITVFFNEDMSEDDIQKIGDEIRARDEVKEVKYDKLSVNMTRYELKVNGVVLDTPPKELELLFHLASNPNRVYTRDQLLDEVWGFEYYGDSRTIDVHVKRLREKLEGVSDQWSLKTVWGVGYKFEVNENND